MDDNPAASDELETIPANSPADQTADCDDEYERTMKHAFALMEKGFHLGGTHKLDRDALHDHKATRDTESH